MTGKLPHPHQFGSFYFKIVMARPLKINADYFSHDNNMRSNRKILALRAKFGHLGYSVWNMFLETLTESNYFKISLDEQEFTLLSGDFQVEPEKLKEILEFCVKIRLLKQTNDCYWSENHIERLQPFIEERERKRKWRYNIKDGTNGVKDGTNLVVDSKVKESKVKESNYSLGLGITIWNERNHWPTDSPLPKNKTVTKLLPLCRKETPQLQMLWKKISPTKEDWDTALKNYILEIANRSPDNDYANHRFSFYDFIKQKNGYLKFLNR
ncbi:DUF4373 domain-containing protein [Candidatus Microgenomates bacterium]|nr:DUF4373 domain-containing protein [Candidatus Microgenomates bacterium]